MKIMIIHVWWWRELTGSVALVSCKVWRMGRATIQYLIIIRTLLLQTHSTFPVTSRPSHANKTRTLSHHTTKLIQDPTACVVCTYLVCDAKCIESFRVLKFNDTHSTTGAYTIQRTKTSV